MAEDQPGDGHFLALRRGRGYETLCITTDTSWICRELWSLKQTDSTQEVQSAPLPPSKQRQHFYIRSLPQRLLTDSGLHVCVFLWITVCPSLSNWRLWGVLCFSSSPPLLSSSSLFFSLVWINQLIAACLRPKSWCLETFCFCLIFWYFVKKLMKRKRRGKRKIKVLLLWDPYLHFSLMGRDLKTRSRYHLTSLDQGLSEEHLNQTHSVSVGLNWIQETSRSHFSQLLRVKSRVCVLWGSTLLLWWLQKTSSLDQQQRLFQESLENLDSLFFRNSTTSAGYSLLGLWCWWNPANG